MEEGSTFNQLIFFVNGKKIVDDDVDPALTLLQYLRNKLLLPGTKLGCGEGGCGACTVMISKIDRTTNAICHFSINACLAPVVTMHGMAVTTVEGIGSTKTKLHPVQERIAKSHGSQCGFCTPGIVMSMYTLLRNTPLPSMTDIEEYFTGNLCRCTGYRPILEGYRTFTSDFKGCGKTNCCQLNKNNDQGHTNSNGYENCNGNGSPDVEETEQYVTNVIFDPNTFSSYDPSQDIIFPPELKIDASFDSHSLKFEQNGVSYYRPTSLSDLLTLKSKYPEAKIIVGNTEVGVEVKFKHQNYPVLINTSMVKELNEISYENSGITFGASVTLTKLEECLKEQVNALPDHATGVFQAIIETLKWFAGKQIRNVASIGGNIMTGSPISDLNPVFMASSSILRLQSSDGERCVKMDENFFTGYRRNIVTPKELLLSIFIPYTQKNEYFVAYKQARRRDDDIAIVNCGLKVNIKPGTIKVKNATMAFGGVAATTVLTPKTMKIMEDQDWDEFLLEKVSKSLLDDINIPPSAPGGMVNYRRALTLSFFFKFYLYVKSKLNLETPSLIDSLNETEKNATISYERPATQSTQLFQRVNPDQAPLDPIGKPTNHVTATHQATGEAVYVDDIPRYNNELYAAFVLSSKASATIKSINYDKARLSPGVHAIYTANDLKEENNKWGVIFKDEEVFASKEVKYVGQIIAMVIADDQNKAQKAARLVQIEYVDIKKPILTIEEAIKAKSIMKELKLVKGIPEQIIENSNNILQGEVHLGGQEHFYMETNCTIAIPHENDEIEIISSTQNPNSTQQLVAQVLGVPQHKVVCKIKRLGGGFGGKETRTVLTSVPVAFAAAKLGKPIRVMLDRDEDMIITGVRHPFLGKWKVAFDEKGKVNAVDIELYSNGGFSADLSFGVLERAILSSDNAYEIENFKVVGKVCKTNLASNTAFRGFGGPQGMFIMEDIMDNIADYLNIPHNIVREQNLYPKTGGLTHYKQLVDRCTLDDCWNGVKEQSNYQHIVNEVAEFNRKNKYQKRGVSIIPVKFGISFTLIKLNQGSVLLLVYIDGTVLISHGGTEMGQGLHTKMIQVAAHTLQIPSELIHIAETSTDKIPNASPTAASASSDIYGDAVRNACLEINERLLPYKKQMPNAKWKEIIAKAYDDRVSLSSLGFHKTPDITQVDYSKGEGCPFNYFSYGAAVSVVEIDCLTGHHTILQTDIVMDVGSSINPAIDIGQIEGAFVQGMGLYTLEELLYSPDGALLTRGPGAYKIPGFQDIPCKFNVSLLRDAPNPRAIYSSKAVGEPPLFLAASVFFAIKNAIKSYREDNGINGPFRLDAPATAERIRMSCLDNITQKFVEEKPGSFRPWCVRV